MNRQDREQNWHQQNLLFTALSDPHSRRFDRSRAVAIAEDKTASPEWKLQAARLLLPATGGGDANRAERLLTDAAPYSEDARTLLAELILPRLRSDDRNARDNAAAQLSKWVDLQTPTGATARTALTPIIVRDLASADGAVGTQAVTTLTNFVLLGTTIAEAPFQQWVDAALRGNDMKRTKVALIQTRRLVAKQHPLGLRILDAEFRRHGGLVRAGRISREQGNLANAMVADDYPPRALREELQGVVEANAILSPTGIVMAVIITRSASPSLDNAVASNLLRRVRGIRPEGLARRYVQMKLPPIQFRLKACREGEVAAPIIAGALLVEQSSCPPPPQSTIVSQ